MKRFIGIKLTVEGFHRFVDASTIFDCSVDFLEHRHRHNFGITIEIPVIHADRDKEFIIFKREVQKYIYEKYGTPAEFRRLSCESIGEDLMHQFNASMVIVDEDGENYAKIIK